MTRIAAEDPANSPGRGPRSWWPMGHPTVAGHVDVGRDTHLPKQVVEVLEPRPPEFALVRTRSVAHEDEHALARARLHLFDEGHRLGDGVEDVAADDEVGGRDLGVLPGAGDDRQVVGG